jgi:hypothetical protein
MMAPYIACREMLVNRLVELIFSGGTNIPRGTIRGLAARQCVAVYFGGAPTRSNLKTTALGILLLTISSFWSGVCIVLRSGVAERRGSIAAPSPRPSSRLVRDLSS